MIQKTLTNGLEVAVKVDNFSRAVAVQCWVNTGAIHEEEHERGMAHYLEHMLFKGTEKRAVGEIAATVETCGGNINAYTSFDHTVYYLTLASEHAIVGIDLLADAVFHSTLDEQEFEREKEVILEEIRRGEDNPSQKVGKRVFELAFAGTEAGRPIIGYTDQVSSYKRDDLLKFYKKWYQPENMQLIVVGNVDEEEVLAHAEETFGQTKAKAVPEHVTIERKWPTGMPISIIKGDYKQPRIEVVYQAPAINDIDTVALDLASFALGSGELGRFNRRLRDKEMVVSSVGSSLYSPAFGGIFEFSAYTSEDKVLDALKGFAKEASNLLYREPVSIDELERARANLRSERVYRDETVEGQARSLGQGLRSPFGLLADDVFAAQMNSMPSTMISKALNKWIDLEEPILVVLLPEDSKINEDQIRQAYLSGLDKTLPATNKAIARESKENDVKEFVFEINDGIKFIYRHNPKAELFSFTAASEGGLRGETVQNAGVYNAIASLLACETEKDSYESLMTKIEGMGAAVEGFSGKDSFGLNGSSLTEQTEELIELLSDSLLRAKFPDEQWQIAQSQILQSIHAQDDSPAGVCVRRFQEQIYNNHPYRFPIYGLKETVEIFTTSYLLKEFNTLKQSGPWVFAACGAMEPEDMAELIKEKFAKFRPPKSRKAFISDGQISITEKAAVRIDKDREQTHIIYGFTGSTWVNSNRYALDVMTNILGGHAGRLFMNLRDRDSLAYTVSPIMTFGRHPGIVGSYIACAPNKETQALQSLQREMELMANEMPLDEEMQRSQANIIGSHDMGLQRSYAQASTMALMELYGIGYDDFLTYPEKIQSVTKEDVQKVAQDYFLKQNSVTVIVGQTKA